MYVMCDVHGLMYVMLTKLKHDVDDVCDVEVDIDDVGDVCDVAVDDVDDGKDIGQM